ncbi:nucleotidyltransferase family protein [Rhizobium rhizogenes]|uniref:nucleotidyltransferase family protein n=1 Tax=Rhizobium rhizogenes TaxID=359 RepID=UPI001571BE88|nr:nucleotidyltransferase family protein [Rhizobium rhizogenes]NTF46135.1 nucleotidyltransferase family protein [Rhizobium rhizogenes]
MNKSEQAKLESIVFRSPLLVPLFRRWREIALPDCWLVAGAVAQTVWNDAFGLPLTHGINDVDIVYFDAGDLSEESEANHAARVRKMFSGLPAWIDVKNEARVHCWYEAKFGYPIPPYTSTLDAVTSFPTTATAVGARLHDDGLEFCAPFGLSDLLNGVVRPNKTQITRAIYQQKVDRWTTVWPRLRVVNWDD